MAEDPATAPEKIPFLTPDALAGIVDLFGGLTREQLADAIGELAFKSGLEIDDPTVDDAIDHAVSAYALTPVNRDAAPPLLVVGPTAFPTLPQDGADLPHILDIDGTEVGDVDRDDLARSVERRLRSEAASAAANGNDDRLETLLDVCFDVDVWAETDTTDVRADIERALEQS